MSKALKSSSVISLLFDFNLKWHITVMKDLLMRYKILFIFLIALAAPSIQILVYLSKLPTINLILIGPGKNKLIYSLLSFQLIGVIWFAINQAIIYKQSWNKYILSLPISNWHRLIIDIYLLLIFNWPLWISILISSASVLNGELSNIQLFIITIEKCVFNITLVLMAQVIWMKCNRYLLLLLIGIDFMLVTIAQFDLPTQLIIYPFFIIFSFTLIMVLYQSTNVISNRNNININFNTNKIKKYPELFLLIKIQFIHLLNNIEQLFAWILAILVSFFLTVISILYDKDQSSLLLILSISILLNSLLASSIFKRVEMQRNLFSNFLSTLPISKTKKFIIDYLMVFPIMLILNLFIFLLFLYFAHADSFGSVKLAMFLSPIALGLSYYPQIKLNNYGSFVSLVIMVLFVYADYLLMNVF